MLVINAKNVHPPSSSEQTPVVVCALRKWSWGSSRVVLLALVQTREKQWSISLASPVVLLLGPCFTWWLNAVVTLHARNCWYLWWWFILMKEVPFLMHQCLWNTLNPLPANTTTAFLCTLLDWTCFMEDQHHYGHWISFPETHNPPLMQEQHNCLQHATQEQQAKTYLFNWEDLCCMQWRRWTIAQPFFLVHQQIVQPLCLSPTQAWDEEWLTPTSPSPPDTSLSFNPCVISSSKRLLSTTELQALSGALFLLSPPNGMWRQVFINSQKHSLPNCKGSMHTLYIRCSNQQISWMDLPHKDNHVHCAFHHWSRP